MIDTTISQIEDLFIFEDDIASSGEPWGVKASLKWDQSKYVVIPLECNNSAKYAAIGALMRQYFKDIVDYIQADVMEKTHRCSQCGDNEYFIDPGHIDDGSYICSDCRLSNVFSLDNHTIKHYKLVEIDQEEISTELH